MTSQVPLQSNSGQHLCPQASQISARASPCQSFSVTAVETFSRKHRENMAFLSFLSQFRQVLVIGDEYLVLVAELSVLLHFPELHHNFQMGQNHLRWHRTGSHKSVRNIMKYQENSANLWISIIFFRIHISHHIAYSECFAGYWPIVLFAIQCYTTASH